MTMIRNFLLAMTAMLMLWVPQGHAEDIDVYSGNAISAELPNILFVMDTGANFSSNAAVACTAYAAGGAPSLGGTAGGVEQCALVDTIAALPDNAVNIGILVNNNNNFGTDVRLPVYSTDDSSTADPNAGREAAHETCQGTYGGCVVRKLAKMNPANKKSLINFIKTWRDSGGNSDTQLNIKSGGDRTANTMQEAWAYYNGKIGMSGKNYASSLLNGGCQKNFIIFIGNALNNSGGPADGGAESPYNGTNALTSAQVAATTAQKAKISETVTFKTNPTCGVASSAATNVASNWSENWGDEWARLMNQQDGGSTLEGAQNIVTYTIGVIDNGGCKPDYPALLTTMAKYGGGKYYQTSNASDVKAALDQILNEIQAVNSVFASASLPVSVNAQGTYLNQIFLGMFRPDASANPRWLGNLKQYQLIFSGSDLVLGDAASQPALSSAGTGFIASTARSFWTTKNVATAPDSAGGFYKNDPKGTPASAYDSPDGELVEKGGTAQQIRLENLTSTFTGAVGGSNPRRMYTYCPSGTCTSDLTHSSNAFTTANTAILASAFGDSTTVPIASIVRTGTTALVTTNGNHGFTAGTTSVTISNANQSEYNVSQVISAPSSANTFTITGLPDYPTTPAAGAYTIATSGAASFGISSIVRSTSASGGYNSETLTVTTSATHNFTAGSTITLGGATPTQYNVSLPIALPGTGACPVATCFTMSGPKTSPAAGTDFFVYPTTPAANTYQVVVSPYSRAISSIQNAASPGLVNIGAGPARVNTSTAHGFHQGQQVTLASTGDNKTNGTFTVASVVSANVFTIGGWAGNINTKTLTNAGATVAPSTTKRTLTGISRAATTISATATATGAPANEFGRVVGDTKTVNISQSAGASTNEGAYVVSSVTITCTNATCTTFTYPITTSPSTTITLSSATAQTSGATSQTVAAGAITRSGTTATISGLTANAFGAAINATNSVSISTSGASFANESAYVGSWTITCATATCTSATFGPVALTPISPATGTNIQAYAAGTAPDKDTVVKWVRGQDNYGDELGPGGGVTVRPSVHGDVLHSRPVVVNYGDTRGLVAFYGANDGVYRAVNGSQTDALGSVPAGGELWSLVLSEHFGDLNRQRVNSPELKLSTTTLASALPKDYFVDGATGAYQKLKSDGTIDTAYLYLTMRRGGRFIYAIDVSTPTAPAFLWKVQYTDGDFTELGQTWSRPRVTLVKGYSNPVLIFGGGYDTSEDSEPPGTGTMGRAIYVVDAITGAMVWSASYGGTSGCSGTTTKATCTVPEMTHSIPSEVAFMDRNSDGFVDRLYVGDTGGNMWRVDFVTTDGTTSGTTPDLWRVTKLAALGCADGPCSAGTTPRKFFYPPTVISVGATAATGSYEAVLVGSGDREHPLVNTANAQSAHNVANRFYMIKDTVTSANPTRSTTVGAQAGIDGIVVRTETNPSSLTTQTALFPAFSSKSVTSFVRASNVMTVTTSANHGFTTGQTVTIDTANPAFLDGQFTITGVPTTSTFTYASLGSDVTYNTGLTATKATVTVPYASSEPGFYGYMAKGEKVVNAPITVSGTTFFGTNRPYTPAVNTCVNNLGEARGYAIDPFTGSATSTVYDGGGLPPSPVAGVVSVVKDGVSTLVRFCMGCGGSEGANASSADDKSAIGNTDPYKAVPKKPTRTYWYRR